MKVCALASGSKGNSIFIKSNQANILIDAGISTKQISLRLNQVGEKLENIDAIFITHEHNDHVYALKVISKRYNIPVFISELGAKTLSHKVRNIETFVSGDLINLKDLKIHTFQIPHDAEDPVGFVVTSNGINIGIATDIGKSTNIIKEALYSCNTIFLEFNHDEEMLLNGKYPWDLKQRIKGNYGHLSNREAVELINDINSKYLKNIFISHISEENNSIEKIKKEIYNSLNEGINKKHFYYTFQHQISECIYLS